MRKSGGGGGEAGRRGGDFCAPSTPQRPTLAYRGFYFKEFPVAFSARFLHTAWVWSLDHHHRTPPTAAEPLRHAYRCHAGYEAGADSRGKLGLSFPQHGKLSWRTLCSLPRGSPRWAGRDSARNCFAAEGNLGTLQPGFPASPSEMLSMYNVEKTHTDSQAAICSQG